MCDRTCAMQSKRMSRLKYRSKTITELRSQFTKEWSTLFMMETLVFLNVIASNLIHWWNLSALSSYWKKLCTKMCPSTTDVLSLHNWKRSFIGAVKHVLEGGPIIAIEIFHKKQVAVQDRHLCLSYICIS